MMCRTLLLSCFVLLLAGCHPKVYRPSGKRPTLLDADTYLLEGTATDPQYGYTAIKPVYVGGYDEPDASVNVFRYLNALRGPNGEAVTWAFEGTCCEYESTRDEFGVAAMQVYSLYYAGQELSPLVIHIDTYHFDGLYAPMGFDFVRSTVP